MATPPKWFPDWTGQPVVIVASGPSAKDVPLDIAKGRARFIAINVSWKLAPWSDVLYGCDFRFWDIYKGVPDFPGIKVTQDWKVSSRPAYGVHRVACDRSQEKLIREPKGRLGWGGNSGFHCINLAVQFGVKRIILVGYDMRCDQGLHWHGKHVPGLNNPTAPNVERWRRVVDEAAGQLKAWGIEAVNCSPVSKLQNYPKMSLADALGQA